MPKGGKRIAGPGKVIGTISNPEIRIWEKIDIRDGCWNYLGGTSSNGYGAFWVNGQNRKPHRYLWELLIGPIPKELEPDHLCFNTICCRIDHIELVTPLVNKMRSNSIPAINARKKICLNGHNFSYTYIAKDGGKHRRCRICKKQRKIDLKLERILQNGA